MKTIKYIGKVSGCKSSPKWKLSGKYSWKFSGDTCEVEDKDAEFLTTTAGLQVRFSEVIAIPGVPIEPIVTKTACETCGKTFKSKGGLKRHINAVHK